MIIDDLNYVEIPTEEQAVIVGGATQLTPQGGFSLTIPQFRASASAGFLAYGSGKSPASYGSSTTYTTPNLATAASQAAAMITGAGKAIAQGFSRSKV